MSPAAEDSEPALCFAGIGKRYGSMVALSGIDLDVHKGTIHALIGENGAGKSTCLGIASGRVAPSEGALRVFGRAAPFGRPRDFKDAGIATIYQELTIAPNLTPSENVFLGRFKSRLGMLDSKRMRRRYEELAADIGVPTHPEIPCSRLSVAERQVLEILRALASEARVILLDEPTAALAPPERAALLRLMNRLRGEGYTMVFVSHNLDEVLEIADRITVFRDGRLVADLPRQGTTKNDLVGLMLGEAKHAKIFADTAQTRATAGEVGKAGVVLQVIDVAIAGVLGPISLEVRTGEILGIGGLVGSGRTELLRCIAGAEPTATGTIVLDGRRHGWPTTVRRARDHGIVLIPEDRKREGVVPLLTAAENIGLAGLARLCRSFVVSPRLIARSAAEMGTRFGFDARRLHSAAGKLSGGNQQKLLLARAASTSPRVLLADEPTRGIDVGAKAEIMDALRQLALEGCAVIVVSSELEEVVAISNRVVVLHEGRKAGEVDGATTPISVAGILNMAFGIATGEAAAKPDHGSRASARAEQHRRSA